jgi:hypothetical protein
LIGVAGFVVVCSVAAGYAGDALGSGAVGLLFVIETLLVFGASLSYCQKSWPRWYERPVDRTRIGLTSLLLFGVHTVVAALLIKRLRFEWGMWVWMGIGVSEIICIIIVLEAVVRHGNEGLS